MTHQLEQPTIQDPRLRKKLSTELMQRYIFVT
jgi:hypothetical protein